MKEIMVITGFVLILTYVAIAIVMDAKRQEDEAKKYTSTDYWHNKRRRR